MKDKKISSVMINNVNIYKFVQGMYKENLESTTAREVLFSQNNIKLMLPYFIQNNKYIKIYISVVHIHVTQADIRKNKFQLRSFIEKTRFIHAIHFSSEMLASCGPCARSRARLLRSSFLICRTSSRSGRSGRTL